MTFRADDFRFLYECKRVTRDEALKLAQAFYSHFPDERFLRLIHSANRARYSLVILQLRLIVAQEDMLFMEAQNVQDVQG